MIELGDIVQEVLAKSPNCKTDSGKLLANTYLIQLGGLEKAKNMTAYDLLRLLAESSTEASRLSKPCSVLRAADFIQDFYGLMYGKN